VKESISSLLLFYYLFGTFCLPIGDFSSITMLPEMYIHCKQTEDKDMTPLDFVTDHLVNIDALFDQHSNGDEQKPHSPVRVHHVSLELIPLVQPAKILPSNPFIEKTPISRFNEHSAQSGHPSSVFRPPIA